MLAVLINNPIILHGLETDSLTDTVHVKYYSQGHCKFTARIHSLGFFSYGGMIANRNPAFDLNFTYFEKHWGCFVSKAVDLYDLHSPYNFSLIMLNKPFYSGRQFSFTPSAGLMIGQSEKIVGKDSDGLVILISSYKASPQLALEHCARFSNVFFDTEFFDWLNRLRLLYSHRHIDVVAMAWHDNSVFDKAAHTSFGFSVAYSRIQVNEHLVLSSSVTAIKMTANTNAEELARASGLSLTIAAVWE